MKLFFFTHNVNIYGMRTMKGHWTVNHKQIHYNLLMFDTVLNMRQYVFLFKALIPEKKIFQETVHTMVD